MSTFTNLIFWNVKTEPVLRLVQCEVLGLKFWSNYIKSMSHAYDVIDNQLFKTLQKSKLHSFLELMGLNQIKIINYLSRGPEGGRYLSQIQRNLSDMRKFTIDQKFLWHSGQNHHFSDVHKKWPRYISFWSEWFRDHLNTKINSNYSPHWSLGATLKIERIFRWRHWYRKWPKILALGRNKTENL